MNTLRLWLPQIFTAISDYEAQHPDRGADLCTMLDAIGVAANGTSPTSTSAGGVGTGRGTPECLEVGVCLFVSVRISSNSCCSADST